ncbi:transforming growth factor beta regulator 1 [Mortierella alpina]|uniref:Transforming growth factor beta regulator 1 n=1 Tax=Mortierella alpina TaxID=64518 RepID=A0A9P6IWD3_MORAP|nr:transforming growth factor beta regulator 1 [Mortierella alpina]
MKDDTLSFKEKYLRLRERFDRVSATQRQYTSDLQVARIKARKLKEENKPSSDSDTSLDDHSDFNDEDEGDMKEEGNGDQPHGRSLSKRMDTMDKRSLTDRSHRDLLPGSLSPEHQSATEPNGNGMGYGNYQTSSSHLTPAPATKSIGNARKGRAEGAPKQTRRATKRADRGRPRAVVPLKTNPDGSLNYPIVVGKGTNEVIIENMGRIVWNGRGYHNHRYIFPVGFRSKKQYTSLSDTSKKTYFISEILDGGEQPVFQITLEDMPEKVFRHSSSSGAWELALKGLMELGFNAKTHASGPDMYGLTNLGVIKYIQEMPNAHRCRRYMPLKWIIDEDNVEGGLDSSSQHDRVGSKSPGRRKKINNSLYASNHEVLVSSMVEEMAGNSRSTTAASSSMSSRPYTPRKYTRRKVESPPEPALNRSSSASHGSSTILAPVMMSGPGRMEDVKREVEQRPAVIATTAAMSTTGTHFTATTTTITSPSRSTASDHEMHHAHPHANLIRDKESHRHYERRYEQPVTEP